MKSIEGRHVSCRVVVEPKLDGLQVCFQDRLFKEKTLGGAYHDLARDLADFCVEIGATRG